MSIVQVSSKRNNKSLCGQIMQDDSALPELTLEHFPYNELEQTILSATLMLYSSRLVARPVKTDVDKYISESRCSRKVGAQNVVCGSKRANQLLEHSTQYDKPGYLN